MMSLHGFDQNPIIELDFQGQRMPKPVWNLTILPNPAKKVQERTRQTGLYSISCVL
jgi:hypothetical protein